MGVWFGVEVHGFMFPIPIACHRARFMAQSIYVMMYELLKTHITFLDESEQSKISQMSEFVGFFHSSWFLKCYLPISAHLNDLKAIHKMRQYKDINSPVA